MCIKDPDQAEGKGVLSMCLGSTELGLGVSSAQALSQRHFGVRRDQDRVRWGDILQEKNSSTEQRLGIQQESGPQAGRRNEEPGECLETWRRHQIAYDTGTGF